MSRRRPCGPPSRRPRTAPARRRPGRPGPAPSTIAHRGRHRARGPDAIGREPAPRPGRAPPRSRARPGWSPGPRPARSGPARSATSSDSTGAGITAWLPSSLRPVPPPPGRDRRRPAGSRPRTHRPPRSSRPASVGSGRDSTRPARRARRPAPSLTTISGPGSSPIRAVSASVPNTTSGRSPASSPMNRSTPNSLSAAVEDRSTLSRAERGGPPPRPAPRRCIGSLTRL